MANLTFSMTIGGTSGSKSISPTDTRALEFLDDLIVNFGEIDDGDGGTRPMTRTEVAQKYLDKLMAGQVEFARGLKHNRRKGEVTPSDDLVGNTD